MLRNKQAVRPPGASSRVINATGPAPRAHRSATTAAPTIERAPQPESAPRPRARTLDARGGVSAPRPTSPRPTARRMPGGRRGLFVAAGLTGGALLIWGLTSILDAVDPPEEDWSSNLSGAVSMSPTSTAPVAPECESGPGDANSGPGVIASFQYAYYALRSGAAVRATVTPDNTLVTEAGMQQGIDTIPPGTTHCVDITEIGPNEYSAKVTETRPNGETITYKQRAVTATMPDGRTLISKIGG